MDRDNAIASMAAIHKIDRAIVDLDGVSNRMADDEERKMLRRAMVEIVGQTYENISRGIVPQYPDLDPDRRAPI